MRRLRDGDDVTVDVLAQQVPLVRFDRLTPLKSGDVLAAGMRLEPTGRNPRHYALGFDDLEDEGVAACRMPAPGRAERLPRRVTWIAEDTR